MKRMHALPIELPLVASGEWDPSGGPPSFVLSIKTPLERGKSYIIIIKDALDFTRTTTILTIPHNKGTGTSPLLAIGSTSTTTYLTLSPTENKLYSSNIVFVEGNVVYIYEMPFMLEKI